ncbi:hypothetical protein FYK55_27440 [Roseiconus nitratireducens]|uniref:Pup deamidase/depupylase n=1 Tax=Roseiconus nitratireducens TaxID=2605748 RepID=A0A5M6CUD9_9BACT|nr:proteasome accessory factor PafA2 family protein [Roseiconus nitratireducens]KAA5538556.1 hypothetical protein FYK55_27440 [Roseiconus nitratireducens]
MDAAASKHSRRSASRGRLVSRLMGMETEYATMVLNRPGIATADLPAAAKIYAAICAAIRRDQPAVCGVFDSDQLFLASGGAVTLESHPSLHSLPGGLVEVATPEVTSPDELLACQRSIDEMVSDAAADVSRRLDLRVLKNSTDALGHVYGCQENYETVVASGAWLLIYRGFVLLLWAMQIASLLLSLPVLALTFTLIALFGKRPHRTESGDEAESGNQDADSRSPSELFESLPGWVRQFLMGMLRLVYLPTVVVLRFVGRHVAFRKQRKYLTAMLVSRVALCGAGDLDHDGRFRLSPKAMAIDVLADMGGYHGEKPIYVYGHWLGQFCAKSFLSLASTRTMWSRRQRLQIGLSDSNLAELAEYVKLGSVSLVLDMIEAGVTKDFVILKRPVQATHAIAADWHLVRRVPTNFGNLNALEIQQRYLKAARSFVAAVRPENRGEASLVLDRWTQLHDVVTAFRRDAKQTRPSLGRVDWLTKRWMIDQLDENAGWAVRKKTDLRYHELSPDGYYRKLAAADPSLALISRDRIEKRRRTPPADSPATKRGWLIREFAGGETNVTAEWRYAVLGEGKQKKRIEFD